MINEDKLNDIWKSINAIAIEIEWIRTQFKELEKEIKEQ